jgi:hypothetical protein
MTAIVAYVDVIACKVVAIVVRTAAVKSLYGYLSNLAVNQFKALAVQTHPTPAYRTLHPGIRRSLVNLLYHIVPIITRNMTYAKNAAAVNNAPPTMIRAVRTPKANAMATTMAKMPSVPPCLW